MKKLIISADDFGYSDSVNHAILLAHQQGILTSTSLMVTGEAFPQAVELAKQTPSLAVGLHLVLVCGKSVLPHSEIPNLVNEDRNFSQSPTLAGMEYYCDSNCRKQLEKEIKAQFQKFKETGLPCAHVDSHLHMYMNPAILAPLLKTAREYGVSALRVPDDDLKLSLDCDKSHYLRKVTHHFIFSRLAKYAKLKARIQSTQYADFVYGLFQTGVMDLKYTQHLLQHLPEGISEIYYHPDFDSWYDSKGQPYPTSADLLAEIGKGLLKPNRELETLLNPNLKEFIAKNGIQLISYKDL